MQTTCYVFYVPHAACYVNRIKSKLLHMDGGLLSVWPLSTFLALGHGVPPFLPVSLTRLWPGGLPLCTSSQYPLFHVFVGGPDTPPTCMFFLFLFTWLILAHIFKPNSRILCIWYFCARIRKYFIHSTNSYKGLSTCQALFWDLVVDTTDKRTYLHITHISPEEDQQENFKKSCKIYDMSDKGDMKKNKAGWGMGRASIWGVIKAGLTDDVANEQKPKEWLSQKKQQYPQGCSEWVWLHDWGRARMSMWLQWKEWEREEDDVSSERSWEARTCNLPFGCCKALTCPVWLIIRRFGAVGRHDLTDFWQTLDGKVETRVDVFVMVQVRGIRDLD